MQKCCFGKAVPFPGSAGAVGWSSEVLQAEFNSMGPVLIVVVTKGSFLLWVLDYLSFKIQILLIKPNVQRVYLVAFGLLSYTFFF